MIVWLYIVFFGIWLLRTYQKDGINLSFYILGIYLLSGVCCMLLFLFYPDTIRYPGRVTTWPMLLLIGMLWLCLFPLVRYANSFHIEALTINEKQLDRFAWCIVVPAIASMIVSFGMLSAVLAYGDFFKARTAYEGGDLSNQITEKLGLFGYFIALGPSLSLLATILAFYYFFYLKRKDVLTVLLFVASLCMIVNNLSIAGREGMARWFLFVGMSVVIFKDYLNFREHKKLWVTLAILIGVILTIFMIITFDRFDRKSSDEGVVYSLLYYIGEQPYYFAYGYERFGDAGMTNSLGSLFPVISGEQFDITKLNARYYADYFLNTFPTIVGTFVIRVGIEKAFLLCILIFLGCYLVFWKLRSDTPVTLTKFVAYCFYYEIMLLGVFYFLHFARFTQFTIVVYILLAWVFSRLGRNEENIGLLELDESTYPILEAENKK